MMKTPTSQLSGDDHGNNSKRTKGERSVGGVTDKDTNNAICSMCTCSLVLSPLRVFHAMRFTCQLPSRMNSVPRKETESTRSELS